MGNAIINLISNIEFKKLLDELYQFGSSLEKEEFNDIDLLLIYKNSEKNKQNEILTLKKIIKSYLFKQYQIDIDITVLSENEEKEKKFLEQVNYIKVY